MVYVRAKTISCFNLLNGRVIEFHLMSDWVSFDALICHVCVNWNCRWKRHWFWCQIFCHPESEEKPNPVWVHWLSWLKPLSPSLKRDSKMGFIFSLSLSSLSLISRILRDKSPMLHHDHISLTFDNTNAVRICWGEELMKREGEKRSPGLYLTGLTPIPPERSFCWTKGHLTILVILMDLSSLNWMLIISGLIFP